MNDFTFTVADFPKIVFGPGSIAKIGEETAPHGKKAFILTGRSFARTSGLLDKVKNLLQEAGVESDHFEGIEPNPRKETIEVAAKQAEAFGADVIIALGGGSVMDASKALITELKMEGSHWDYVFRGTSTKVANKGMPLITVPTTAATGSETNAAAVITNWTDKEKMPLSNAAAKAKVAIMDPELTCTLSDKETLNGGVDIMSHILETYIPSKELGLQDRFSESAYLSVMESLVVLKNDPKNLAARSQLLYSNNAAMTFPCTGGRDGMAWSFHFMEHVLSAHYDIPHAVGLAAITEAWLKHVAKTVPYRVAKFGKRVFGTEGAESAAKAVGDYYRSLGFTGLKAAGIPEDKIDFLADDTVRTYGFADGCVAAPTPLNRDDVASILRASL